MRYKNQIDFYKFCPNCKTSLVLSRIEKDEVKVCKKCGFVFWDNPKPVVSLIIHKEKKVLMIQRAKEPFKNGWVLPGGFVKKDETPQEAAIREAHEETGLNPKIEGFIGFYGKYFDPRGIHIDAIFFGTAGGEIELSKENKKWKYFSFDKLPDDIPYRHREAIEDWVRGK